MNGVLITLLGAAGFGMMLAATQMRSRTRLLLADMSGNLIAAIRYAGVGGLAVLAMGVWLVVEGHIDRRPLPLATRRAMSCRATVSRCVWPS